MAGSAVAERLRRAFAATPAVDGAAVVAEAETPQFMFSPAVLPAGKDTWAFRLPQGNAVMAHAMIEHMKKNGVKTVGFLGYTDAYGESWLNDFKAQSQLLGGPQIVATERFARADTSVTGQALKLVSANPDAMLIVASGSGAAMPRSTPRPTCCARGCNGRVSRPTWRSPTAMLRPSPRSATARTRWPARCARAPRT